MVKPFTGAPSSTLTKSSVAVPCTVRPASCSAVRTPKTSPVMVSDFQGQVPPFDGGAADALCGPTAFSCCDWNSSFSGAFGAEGVTTGSNGLGIDPVCAPAVADKRCVARKTQRKLNSACTRTLYLKQHVHVSRAPFLGPLTLRSTGDAMKHVAKNDLMQRINAIPIRQTAEANGIKDRSLTND